MGSIKSVVIGFVALACAALFVLSVNSRAQAQISAPPRPNFGTPIQTWEYRVVDADDKTSASLQAQLGMIGKEGWELVSTPAIKGGHSQALVFTRPIRQ